MAKQPRFIFVPKRPDEHTAVMVTNSDGSDAGRIAGEIHDQTAEWPIAYVYCRTLGVRITAALNAQEALFTGDPNECTDADCHCDQQ